MTLSKEERLDDVKRALQTMWDALGEQAIDAVYFDINQPPFTEIHRTTWMELTQRYLIKSLGVVGAERYRLTGGGWYCALDLSGHLMESVTMEKLSKLAAALKNSVNGRREPALVSVSGLALDAGVSVEWVINAIESDVIGKYFNVHSAAWAGNYTRGTMVHVPLNFGLRYL